MVRVLAVNRQRSENPNIWDKMMITYEMEQACDQGAIRALMACVEETHLQIVKAPMSFDQ